MRLIGLDRALLIYTQIYGLERRAEEIIKEGFSYRIGNAIVEVHELYRAIFRLPVGKQCKQEGTSRFVRVGR